MVIYFVGCKKKCEWGGEKPEERLLMGYTNNTSDLKPIDETKACKQSDVE
jgi:hypothetical protein